MIRSPLPRPPVPAVLLLPVLMLVADVASGAGVGGVGGGGRGADGEPMVVTSDTLSYCTTLSKRIAAAGDLPPAVCTLRREGDSLCARGEVRIGIRRLRRALVALDAENHAPAAAEDAAGSAEGCR